MGEGLRGANEWNLGVILVSEVTGLFQLLQCPFQLGSEVELGVGLGVDLRVGYFLGAFFALGLGLAGPGGLGPGANQLHGFKLLEQLLDVQGRLKPGLLDADAPRFPGYRFFATRFFQLDGPPCLPEFHRGIRGDVQLLCVVYLLQGRLLDGFEIFLVLIFLTLMHNSEL